MSSSNNTYNVFLRHAPSDSSIVEVVAEKLHGSGLRPWFQKWSTIPRTPFDGQVELGLSASRVMVSVVGSLGLSYWREENSWGGFGELRKSATITVLAPGFPYSIKDLPSALESNYVIDLRKGLNETTWDQLVSLIVLLGSQTETVIDPHGKLGPRELKGNTIRSYDCIAEKFASQWFEYPPTLPLEKLKQRLPRKASVLDAGCGPGHHAKLLADSGHDVIGIDLSEKMLQIASKSVESVHFKKMDVQMLAFAPRTFDAVWCAAVALHIPREEIIQTLRGFHRVLKPGGVLGLNLQVGRQSEIVEYGHDHRFFEYYRDSSEVGHLLNFAGFAVEGYDYAETNRNTHNLDLKLNWSTLYARPEFS